MQAALDIPMTVYGTGGQTRGFIHVTDTAKCLEAAVVNPPPSNGPVEIFNQASFFLCLFLFVRVSVRVREKLQAGVFFCIPHCFWKLYPGVQAEGFCFPLRVQFGRHEL